MMMRQLHIMFHIVRQCARAIISERDGTGVNICTLNQVIDGKEGQHFDGEV